MSEMDMEKPADDVFEQERALVETEGDYAPEHPDLPLDANEADVAEQDRTVSDDDDDDYR